MLFKGRFQKRCRIATLIIGALLFVSLQAFAVNADSLPQVSLQEVLVDVTKTNPAILEALEHYRSVLAERSIATSEYFPRIGTTISAGPERTKGVPTNDEEKNLAATTATLYARQNLFNGGKTSAFVDETDARIKAAAFEVLTVANKVYLETAEAYINVLKTKELLKIAEQNAYTQEQIMRQVREKTEAGFNRVSELYNSESRFALSKGSFISRQQDLNQAVARFHRQFGRLLLPEQFVEPQPSYQAPDTLSETIDVAFKNHPALKVAKYNIQTRQFTFEKSKAAYWPTLDLELQGQYRDDTGGEEGATTQAGAYLTVNYDFWDGGLRSGVKARDLLELRKERQREYVERRNLNESVRLAWNIMEAEAAKKSYLVEHVMLSAKTLQAFKEEYFVGRRTLLDLLNMENEYTDAKLSRTDSEFAYLVSIYRLMQATGLLLHEHDTGLRETLQLPMDNREDLAGYEDIASNRDEDLQVDDADQCDNSAAGQTVEAFGCAAADRSIAGYPQEEGAQLPPYIAPKESIGPVNYRTMKETAAQEKEMAKTSKTVNKIVLEARPNSDYVTDEALNQLAQLVPTLNQTPDSDILIEGYIASDISSEENTALSERRAGLVRDFLVEHGVDQQRITVVGRGNDNPVASNDTSAGRKQNRRIEITVIPR